MKRALLLSLLLALSAAAAGQTAPQAIGSTQEMCSGGPVVADWGNKLGQLANTTEGKIFKEVRHELLVLPYYSLFDDLEYCVQGRTVVLSGTLTSQHSVTKEDAQAAVKRIEGVEQVTNNIKILSPNPLDQRAREQVYRKLVNTGGLSQYFWEAAPSIHIIVDNLHLTLKGYVNSEGDKNLASITAKQISSLFSVTNELQVVK
ncbi:MAG TPA: BON domain-containing protein [Bryocella sp.]|nr:BON domain-containing protein [Bryocella sp.]